MEVIKAKGYWNVKDSGIDDNLFIECVLECGASFKKRYRALYRLTLNFQDDGDLEVNLERFEKDEMEKVAREAL